VTALSVSGPDDWAALCSRTFVPLRVRTADPAFRAGLDHVALTDSAGITTVRSTASEVFRSARQIRSDPRDGFLYRSGFNDVGTFTRAFGRRYGQSPSAFRRTVRATPDAVRATPDSAHATRLASPDRVSRQRRTS
jgi:hypothetical protein